MGAITALDDLFAAPLTQRCVLSSGVEVCLKALSMDQFYTLRDKRDAVPESEQGRIYALYAIMFSVVHSDTHEQLISEDEIETLGRLSIRDTELLIQAINELNNFTADDEEPDPVKKPENGSMAIGTSATASPPSTGRTPGESRNIFHSPNG